MEIEVNKPKEGLKTAVAELHDRNLPIPGADESEQLGLLPELPLDSGFERQGSAGPRGRGRPPGAKNKNTEEWRKFLLATGRSPLEVLQQTFSCSIEQLARALGRDAPVTFDQALELYKLQIQAAKELAPYVHQKMPLAIDNGNGGGLIQLVINQGLADAQGIQNAAPHAFKILNSPDEQNQLVSENDFNEMTQSRHNDEKDVGKEEIK